jgi:hypothetical protein
MKEQFGKIMKWQFTNNGRTLDVETIVVSASGDLGLRP